MSNRISAETRVYRRPLTVLSAKPAIVAAANSAVTRMSVATSRPMSARSKKSRERSGNANDSAVLVKLMTSTSPRRRQYGTTKDSARRRSRSITGSLEGRGRIGRQHEELGGDVAVERDRAHVFERSRVVQVDRVPGLVDVQDRAVRARFERHPGPPLEFSPAHHAVTVDVELPEFVMADFLDEQSVTDLAI